MRELLGGWVSASIDNEILVMLLDTLDPPKSPLERGTLILVPPFLRGI
jgi:hypothetical protein